MSKRKGNAIAFKGWKVKATGEIIRNWPDTDMPVPQHMANALKRAMGYGPNWKLVPQYDR